MFLLSENGTKVLLIFCGKRTASLLEYQLSGYIDGLGDAVEKGLVKAVGVSNYNGMFQISAVS